MSKKLNFENPPLISTVMDVQFRPIAGYLPIYANEIWDLFKKEFPIIGGVGEPQNLSPILQEINSQQTIQIQLSNQVPHPRYIFNHKDYSSKNGGELIQFQGNRFIHSWQKGPEGNFADYPRHDTIIKKFNNELVTLEDHFKSYKSKINPSDTASPMIISEIVLQYYNKIEIEKDSDNVLSDWIKISGIEELNPESNIIIMTHKIDMQKIAEVARINIHISHVKKTEKPFITITLNVQANLKDNSISGAKKFFDIAHDNIIEYFLKITTEIAHQRWRRLT